MVQTRSQRNGNVVARKVIQGEDEMEAKVWEVRNEMVGMKNVNMQKKEKITKKIMKVLGELEEIDEAVMATEVMMDLLKFQWKFVLKGLMTLKAFKNEFDHVYEHINCECGECIPEWLQVQISQFKQDFENLMANFMLCEKREKFDKVLIELACLMVGKITERCDSMLPSILGMKVGKYNLLPINPKTKDEYVRMIKYTLAKSENSKGKQRIMWSLQAIEHGFNFVKDCGEMDGVARFKKTIITKINEFIAEPKINENQKARLRFLLTELGDLTIEPEVPETIEVPKIETTPKWVQKQTEKFLKQFDVEIKNYQQATVVQKSESPIVPVSPRIEQIKQEERNKCLIDYQDHSEKSITVDQVKDWYTMPVGRARSLEYAKSVFMKKF